MDEGTIILGLGLGLRNTLFKQLEKQSYLEEFIRQ